MQAVEIYEEGRERIKKLTGVKVPLRKSRKTKGRLVIRGRRNVRMLPNLKKQVQDV